MFGLKKSGGFARAGEAVMAGERRARARRACWGLKIHGWVDTERQPTAGTKLWTGTPQTSHPLSGSPTCSHPPGSDPQPVSNLQTEPAEGLGGVHHAWGSLFFFTGEFKAPAPNNLFTMTGWTMFGALITVGYIIRHSSPVPPDHPF